MFRTLQGVFGASLVPLSQALMMDTYTREEQGNSESCPRGLRLNPAGSRRVTSIVNSAACHQRPVSVDL